MKFSAKCVIIFVCIFLQPLSTLFDSALANTYTAYTPQPFNVKERTESFVNKDKGLLTNMELDTLKLSKGRKFIVVSDRSINDTAMSGTPIVFESVQKEYLSYNKTPAKVVFRGRIAKTNGPKIAGKSGNVKIALEKITIDKITYPVDALISKINNKAVYFNTLSSSPVYLSNLAQVANEGVINTGIKDPCASHMCTAGTVYTKPLVYLGAAAVQAADLLIAPLAAIGRKGNSLVIPDKTYFEIKLDKDLYVLDI